MLNRNVSSHQRSGFNMIELSLALIVISGVMIASFKGVQSTKESLRMQKEHDFYDQFDKALNISFNAITDNAEKKCSAIVGTGWGWKNVNCATSSPLPVFDGSAGGEKIIFNIATTMSASANEDAQLISTITNAFAPYCLQASRVGAVLTLRCGNLRGLTYNVGAGAVASPHTVGMDVNPILVPTYTITYFQRREVGNVSQNVTFNGTLAELWSKRQNYSLEKINAVATGIKAFNNTKMMAEVENPAPNGLNSVDDEFVPWFWEAFGTSTPAVISAATCTVGGGVCTNLSSPGIWRTGAALNKGDVWTFGLEKFASGNPLLKVDGFNNQLFMAPIASLCSGNVDLAACVNNPPSTPGDNYFSTAAEKPPYSSVIFNDTCKMTDIVAPSYCRSYIVY
jgi:hypothetical protein